MPSTQHDLVGCKVEAPNTRARETAAAKWFRDGHLDRIARPHVQSMQPRRGLARECGAGRQSLGDGGQFDKRAFLETDPAI